MLSYTIRAIVLPFDESPVLTEPCALVASFEEGVEFIVPQDLRKGTEQHLVLPEPLHLELEEGTLLAAFIVRKRPYQAKVSAVFERLAFQNAKYTFGTSHVYIGLYAPMYTAFINLTRDFWTIFKEGLVRHDKGTCFDALQALDDIMDFFPVRHHPFFRLFVCLMLWFNFGTWKRART